MKDKKKLINYLLNQELYNRKDKKKTLNFM